MEAARGPWSEVALALLVRPTPDSIGAGLLSFDATADGTGAGAKAGPPEESETAPTSLAVAGGRAAWPVGEVTAAGSGWLDGSAGTGTTGAGRELVATTSGGTRAMVVSVLGVVAVLGGTGTGSRTGAGSTTAPRFPSIATSRALSRAGGGSTFAGGPTLPVTASLAGGGSGNGALWRRSSRTTISVATVVSEYRRPADATVSESAERSEAPRRRQPARSALRRGLPLAGPART